MVSASEAQPTLILSLLRPEAYPHPVGEIELIETHISWVLLTGRFAYKIKKPINLGFVQAASLSQRQHYCQEELRLNRRLAPKLYLGVVPVVGPEEEARILSDDIAFESGQSGTVIETAVKMRQFQPQKLLGKLLTKGAIETKQLTALAWDLGHFHQSAIPAASDSRLGSPDQVCEPVFTNLDVLKRLASKADQQQLLSRHCHWVEQQQQQLRQRFATRQRHGAIRECHGDLHCSNIHLTSQGHLEVFDSIDFNPSLRWIDPISEMAFLVMDLQTLGHQEQAIDLLNAWLECTGAYDGMDLWPWYHAYRAMVRAKVSAIQAEQCIDPQRKQGLLQDLDRYLNTACTNERQARGGLVLMHGLSGSGKSTVSKQLCSSLGAVRIRSDRERARAFTSTATHPARYSGNRYRQEVNSWLFETQLPQLAEHCLMSGFHVIIDATFLRRHERHTMAAVAQRLDRPQAIVACHCAEITAQTRINQRQERGNDPSEADSAVRERQKRWLEPLDTDEQKRTVFADETTSFAAINTALAKLLQTKDDA